MTRRLIAANPRRSARAAAAAASLVLGLSCTAALAEPACLTYGPAPVALTGMVNSLQVSGPPGYGATPKTDAIVQVPILQLSPAICVDGDPANPANTPEQNLNSVQLVFQPGGPQFRAELAGTSFVVSGTLAHASGPEHITPVVLMVGDIKQVLAPVEQTPAP
ncbi:hypothetical protein [Emcibacter sp. SYSU 3D8]|uniref:hypothetical protein n=1 Tax=Emcibacter sp. SYSU 3D8 TaxID=3133969 RepID=UPI0031FE6561